VRWSLTDPGFDGTFGPMAIADGVLYAVGVGGKLLAVDAAGGRILWSRSIESEAEIPGGLCLQDGKLYVGDSEISVISAKCGLLLAKYDIHEMASEAPAETDNGRLYVLGNHRLWSLRAWNGQP
jgi:outer membrane protein assembly factor BamB